MAHRTFLIRYSNGFKRHVSKAELDLLKASLTQIGPRQFLCSASLNEEADLKAKQKAEESAPNYLDMRMYIFEYPPDREYEREYTPQGIVRKITQMGFNPEIAA